MPDATERKVLIICVFVAGCITLGPMDWISAGLLIVSSAALALWNIVITGREQALLEALSAWSPAATEGAPAALPASS
mgnify:CR=1 FL=1